MRFFLTLLLVLSFAPWAVADEEPAPPLWEWGLGLGYIRYADYPSSDEYSDLMLPFPTFQYRGEYLRADDREGGRAYLFKSETWSLEFSGGGRLPLDSSKNQARQGMENLPLVLDGGPQLVWSSGRTWEFQLAPFLSAAAYGSYIRQNGMRFKAQLIYRWESYARGPFASPIYISGTTALEMNAASQEYMRTYFEVDAGQATSSRVAYNAVAGFLSNNLSYYQRFSSGRFSLYVGASVSDYTWSANRSSPLHKSDLNVGYGVGMIYQFGESAKPSISPEDTQGVINRYRQIRHDRLFPGD